MIVRRRFFVIVLLCVVVTLSFCSCDIGNEGDERIESMFDQIVVDSSSDVENLTDVAEHIYVLISKESSSSLAKRAQDFVEMIREKTGLLADLKYDNELSSTPIGALEILIGSTNRLESQNALDMLKFDGYICRWDTASLVICGGSDEATLEALELFISRILPNANRYSIMEENISFEFIDGKFKSSGITLSAPDIESKDNGSESENGESLEQRSTFNGYVIDEFLIVYNSANEHSERVMAEILCSAIKERSGYLLEVVSSKELNSRNGKTISIVCSKNETPSIESVDGSIAVKGNNAYSISLGVAEFIERMDSCTKDGVITLDFEEKINVANESFEFSFMTYFMKQGMEYDSLLELLDTLDKAENDVFIITNVGGSAAGYLPSNLPAGYKLFVAEFSQRTLNVVYDANSVAEVSLSFGEDESVMELIFEFANGETVRYFYLLNASSFQKELTVPMGKSVCFFEGDFSGVEISSGRVLTEGTAKVDSNQFLYGIAAGDLLYECAGETEVKNTALVFSCTTKLATDVSYKLIELTDSFK